MERPERPSRHKSNPNWYTTRPSFSSDSESEPTTDNEGPIQITFYQSDALTGATSGPSTSSQVTPVAATENPTPTMRGTGTSSPVTPLRVTLSPIPLTVSREVEVRSEESPAEVVRRKRLAASSAASVIFDSVDTLISSNSSMSVQICDNRSGSPERFPPGEYVIRPKSFCNMGDVWRTNAIRPSPSSYKIKRFNAPIDLTPSTSSRDTSAQPAAGSSASFGLQDTPTLPTNTETTTNSFYSRGTTPLFLSTRNSQPSTSSSILRQFDEMCSTGPTPTKRRKFVRFFEGTRYSNESNESPSIMQPSSLPTASVSASVRSNTHTTSLDDYCDLVGNFLFNYPSSEHQRSPPVAVAVSEPHTSSTADIIDRHAHSIISEINSYLDPPEPRGPIDGGEVLEQSNDDVIVVETPERPPLPESPDPYIVPSSRSPSPTPLPPPRAAPLPSTTVVIQVPKSPPRLEKPPWNAGSEVPMTLPELNQSLVALLECPVCLDHATPPIYQCVKGHILCQNCHPRLTSCPMCRSRLPGDRNSVMEKVAEKLMYPCKNTVTGCTMMLKLNDKQVHEDGCGFRHYACIDYGCSWKGYKPELVVHLQSNHPDKLITGATKELHVPITRVGACVVSSSGAAMVHHWLQSAHNEVFHVVFNVDTVKRIMKGCVIYVGSREKADKFEYLFQLKQRVSPYRKLSYSRTTHVDTLKQGQPLCLRDDFSINIDMAQLYRPADCCHQIIPIFITINQLE